jgi:hypothetical protein
MAGFKYDPTQSSSPIFNQTGIGANGMPTGSLSNPMQTSNYTSQNPWLNQYNNQYWNYAPIQDDRSLQALGQGSSGMWEGPWGPVYGGQNSNLASYGMSGTTGDNTGTGWKNLPAGINYGQLPWFNYLQGNSDLPYWRGPQGMPVPSTQSWNQLSPSEQGMYQGMLETQGVYMPDFQNKMQRLSPSWSNTLPQVNWSR